MKKVGEQKPVNINLDMGDSDDPSTVEEALARVTTFLAQTTNPKVLSSLDDSEIKLCAALFAVSEKVKDKMVLNFLNNFLLLRVSDRRQGRKELLQIAQAAREMPEQKLSRIRNIFGFGGAR